jgi:hypothetical protein
VIVAESRWQPWPRPFLYVFHDEQQHVGCLSAALLLVIDVSRSSPFKLPSSIQNINFSLFN